MNRQTLASLQVCCGVDTFEVTTNKPLLVSIGGITSKGHLQPCNTHGLQFKYKVNPDKVIDGASGNIDKLKAVFEFVKKCFDGATELFISRIDYRFDDMSNDYNRFYKLNRLLLSMLAVCFNSSNNYSSSDLLTAEKLTVRFDCDHSDLHISGEYYNKERQEPSGEVKTRLELRSRQLYIPFLDGSDYESFLLAEWLERINEALTADTFNSVIQICTEGIIEGYKTNIEECGNLTEYFVSVRDNIYTTRQLSNLYGILGRADTARQSAYKYRHGDKKTKGRKLPCFSLADLILYRDKLEQAAFKFFETQSDELTKVA
ncbi:MAG: hypothetical protein J5726_10600 [Treponema sp.]|nr:hypothetical protein [Treponema sp.]